MGAPAGGPPEASPPDKATNASRKRSTSLPKPEQQKVPTMQTLKARGWWKQSINASVEQNINTNFLCGSFKTGVTMAQLKTQNERIQAELTQLSTNVSESTCAQPSVPPSRQEPDKSVASSQKRERPVTSIGTPTQSAPGSHPRASVTGLLAELTALANLE